MQRAALLGFAVVLALLLGALWLTDGPSGPPPLDARPAHDDHAVASPEASAPPLWPSFAPDYLAAVRFVDKAEPGVTLRRTDAAWLLAGPDLPETQAVPLKARAVFAAAASLAPLRRLEGTGPDADYGLGATAMRVHLTLRDGSARTLVVGDVLTVGEGRYVRVAEQDGVFVLPILPLQVLLGDPANLITPLPEGP